MTLTVVVANLKASKPRTPAQRLAQRRRQRRYRRHLRRQYRPDAMLLQEVGGLGRRSTRVAGKKVRQRRRVEVGNTGAHRWAALGALRLDPHTIDLGSVHGLHKGTVGQRAQDAYFAHLAKGAPIGPLELIGGDFNRRTAVVAKALLGRSVGNGIEGLVYGPRLKCTRWHEDRTGLRAGWTDHPAIVATFVVVD